MPTIATSQPEYTLYMVWPKEQLHVPPAFSLPEGYRLRPYRRDDAKAYCDLVNLDGWEEVGWVCHERALRWLLNRALPGGFFLVEEQECQRLVSTAVAMHLPQGDDYYFPFGGQIGVVFTHPDHRGRGLGYAVSAAATTRLIAAGYENIRLNTTTKRLPALNLYLKMGYVPFLYAEELVEQWRTICAQLGRPFTPDQWPTNL